MGGTVGHLHTPAPPEMRAYAQRLLDFLRRAEEFFQARLDVSFFTQALPRALEQLYTHLFPTQVHQVTAGTATPHPAGARCLTAYPYTRQMPLRAPCPKPGGCPLLLGCG